MANSYGSLTVRAETAGAYPIEGALVRVRGADEENFEYARSFITDKDGMTEKIYVPTPPKGLSSAPNTAMKPYSIYDIEIVADGYLPQRISGLTVFPGINSIQIIGLVPEEIN